MPKISTQIELSQRTKKIYSDIELKFFNQVMEQFRRKINYVDVKGIEVNTSGIEIRDYFVSQGAMKKKMHAGTEYYTVVVNYDGSKAMEVPLGTLEDKVEQWQRWKTRNEFVEQLKIGELQNTANELGMSMGNW